MNALFLFITPQRYKIHLNKDVQIGFFPPSVIPCSTPVRQGMLVSVCQDNVVLQTRSCIVKNKIGIDAKFAIEAFG